MHTHGHVHARRCLSEPPVAKSKTVRPAASRTRGHKMEGKEGRQRDKRERKSKKEKNKGEEGKKAGESHRGMKKEGKQRV